MVCRKIPLCGRKPTVSTDRKAAVLDAIWRVFRTPPGSKTRACIHGGNLGTWESQWSPCVQSGVGVPSVEVKTPGAERRLEPLKRAFFLKGTQRKTSDARYRARRGRTERTRDGLLAVLADHSTDGRERKAPGREGGEPTSQEPTGGKVKPGITLFWEDLWEILRDHQPYP